MNKVAHNIFQNQIDNLKETPFQEFVAKFYLVCYGAKFTLIKQKKDKGCDGILHGDTILAVYGPSNTNETLAKFKRKIGKDFTKYQKNWMNEYPHWQVVYNGIFTAERIKFVETLKPDAKYIGQDHIMQQLSELRWSQIQDIAKYLDIDESFLIFDVIDEIVKDLLKTNDEALQKHNYKGLTDIEKKIALNFDADDVETIKDEFANNLLYAETVKEIIGNYSDRDINALKNRVRQDINKFEGNFKTKFNYLTEAYVGNRIHDDYYKLMVRILLTHLFEKCLIGKKIGITNDITAS